ncbi:hypothetical protein C2C78_05480 [Escherichia coli H8]|nr:hypothetical protein [Escherichia coli H8]
MALNAKLMFKICARRGASLGVTILFSLVKRALTEVFQISIGKPRNTKSEERKSIVITLNNVCKD